MHKKGSNVFGMIACAASRLFSSTSAVKMCLIAPPSMVRCRKVPLHEMLDDSRIFSLRQTLLSWAGFCLQPTSKICILTHSSIYKLRISQFLKCIHHTTSLHTRERQAHIILYVNDNLRVLVQQETWRWIYLVVLHVQNL